MFNGKPDNGYPPPNSYLPSLKMTQAGGFGKIHFGLGLGSRKNFAN